MLCIYILYVIKSVIITRPTTAQQTLILDRSNYASEKYRLVRPWKKRVGNATCSKTTSFCIRTFMHACWSQSEYYFIVKEKSYKIIITKDKACKTHYHFLCSLFILFCLLPIFFLLPVSCVPVIIIISLILIQLLLLSKHYYFSPKTCMILYTHITKVTNYSHNANDASQQRHHHPHHFIIYRYPPQHLSAGLSNNTSLLLVKVVMLSYYSTIVYKIILSRSTLLSVMDFYLTDKRVPLAEQNASSHF